MNWFDPHSIVYASTFCLTSFEVALCGQNSFFYVFFQSGRNLLWQWCVNRKKICVYTKHPMAGQDNNYNTYYFEGIYVI